MKDVAERCELGASAPEGAAPERAAPERAAPERTAPERTVPERTSLIRLATARLCLRLGWAPLHEVRLANGRRADILALQPSGLFVCIEIKSGARDYLSDAKWHDYRPFCDQFFFAIDCDFPQDILPSDPGLIVCAEREADVVREAETTRMPPARRKALMARFAWLAAGRLAAQQDPMGVADLSLGLYDA